MELAPPTLLFLPSEGLPLRLLPRPVRLTHEAGCPAPEGPTYGSGVKRIPFRTDKRDLPSSHESAHAHACGAEAERAARDDHRPMAAASKLRLRQRLLNTSFRPLPSFPSSPSLRAPLVVSRHGKFIRNHRPRGAFARLEASAISQAPYAVSRCWGLLKAFSREGRVWPRLQLQAWRETSK